MRRTLVAFLGIAAAVLSFDALYARALTSGLIPAHAFIWPWLLAALWAFTIDGAGAAGILGIKADPRDKRGWLMFALAALASLGFQATTPPITWTSVLAKAVAPIALGFAIVVLELPRTKRSPAPVPEPAPTARAAAPTTAARATLPAAGRRGRPAGADAPSPTTPAGGGLTPAQARLIRNLADQSERATMDALKAAGIGTRRERVGAERARLKVEGNGHAAAVAEVTA